MAYCKTVSKAIKSEKYLYEALSYITNPKKASQVSFVTENIIIPDNDVLSIENAYRRTRNIKNKNTDILAHHFVQSFDDYDNVTPELAHKIGLEFIKNNLSNYQVTLATHIDGNHMHNHFIINSVSPVDGLKFKGNKSTIRALRQASDDLCVKYNLSVIEKGTQSKYNILDNETLQCAKKGISWKVQLVKDLDSAFENCKTKNDFISFMKNKNYKIKWTEKNITFQKDGVNKGIRADTLAKQFGTKYSKASIEYKLNIITKQKQENKIENNQNKISSFEYKRYQLNKFAVSEWRRQEKINQKNTIPYAYEQKFNKVLYAKSPLDFTIRLICYMFMSQKNKQGVRYRNDYKSTYKVKSYTDVNKKKQFVSNVNYNTLLNSPGNTIQLKLYSWQISKLLDRNILFTSKIDLSTGTALITAKNLDLGRIANTLGIPYEKLKSQSTQINYRKIKYQIAKSDEKTEYLVIPKELLNKLEQYKYIEFSSKYRSNDKKYLISFSSKDKNQILSLLFPNRKEQNKDSFYLKNLKINREIKEQAQETNQKVCYKIVVNSQYKKLRNTDINFAVFLQDDGKYNIVYLENDKQKINKVLGGDKKINSPTTREKNNLKL